MKFEEMLLPIKFELKWEDCNRVEREFIPCDDRLEEIHTNQIAWEDLSEDDRKLLMDDIDQAMMENEGDIFDNLDHEYYH